MKAGGGGRESKDICGLSEVENEGSDKAEKVKGESVHALKKKKKRAKERLYEGYKGFEKVVENKEIAEKSGLGKIFNQAEKVESVKVAKKKEKRGREKFEKEFESSQKRIAQGLLILTLLLQLVLSFGIFGHVFGILACVFGNLVFGIV